MVLGVAPGLFVALFIGGVIDRGSKRKILIIADMVRGMGILAVPFAAWFGMLDMHLLYVVMVTVGSATAVFQIADNSFCRFWWPRSI